MSRKEFWNQRYNAEAYAYGTQPNTFFKEQLDQLAPGRLLLPAEGEGRNAVYAASQGWQVSAFDTSEAGQAKAMRLARQKGVSIDYRVGTLDQLDFSSEQFDAAGLIFAHFAPEIRKNIHQQITDLLRPQGFVILEAFSPKQLLYNSKNPQAGGPKKASMLYDRATLQQDFPNFDIILLQDIVVELEEGSYHIGESSVVRMLAQKVNTKTTTSNSHS